MLHRQIAAGLAAALLLASAAPVRADNGRPTDPQIEQFLVGIPSASGIGEDLAKLNEAAHYPGSGGDKDLAYWMRDQLAGYGFQATVEPVYAQVPQLHAAVLQLMTRPTVDFDLKDAPIAQDPDGTRPDAGVPFSAWSGSGNVTVPLVYANGGLDADYHTLAQAGVSVAGRIVLIRYGAQFRGELARRAQDHGAAGVILYSDPAGRDGATHGAAYPDGPYRPLGTAQRGSLAYPRLTIPVLPVSALTARRLLQAIHGAAPPAGWRGGIDAGYELGTTAVPVHLRVDERYPWITIWNTIGVLPGDDLSHEVIFGGHRDAWVYGVTDNGSGISTLLEAAHALGYIYHTGWRPHYSIVVAGWDGEEIGEAGSNAYVRTHYDALRHGCIAYVNADENVTGRVFAARAAAALAPMLPPVTRLIPDPHLRSANLWQRWRAQPGGVEIAAPGGGSDHEPFLYLLGIPVMEAGFYGPFGVYHSAYDDLRYARTQADPYFVAHRAMAQTLALLAFRMTSGPLPYNLAAYVAPMQAALHNISAENSTGADLSPVAQAIARLSDREAVWARHPDFGQAIDAAQRLDLIFYGRDGYQPIAFPQLSNALASGDAAAVTRAVNDTAGGLDAVLR